MLRVGQNRIYAPYMTVYLVISLPKIPFIHRIYMVLANPTYATCTGAPKCASCLQLATMAVDVHKAAGMGHKAYLYNTPYGRYLTRILPY